MGRHVLGILCVVFAAVPGWAATLESPANGAVLSGLGFISGWKCDAGQITVTINGGGHIPVAMAQPRGDIRHICGTLHHGFITQWNWALLGNGVHTLTAYDDGLEFAHATFTVRTTGEEFLKGASGQCYAIDFPSPGEHALLEWEESTQHFELVEIGDDIGTLGVPDPDPEPDPQPSPHPETLLAPLLGTWRAVDQVLGQSWTFTLAAIEDTGFDHLAIQAVGPTPIEGDWHDLPPGGFTVAHLTGEHVYEGRQYGLGDFDEYRYRVVHATEQECVFLFLNLLTPDTLRGAGSWSNRIRIELSNGESREICSMLLVSFDPNYYRIADDQPAPEQRGEFPVVVTRLAE